MTFRSAYVVFVMIIAVMCTAAPVRIQGWVDGERADADANAVCPLAGQEIELAVDSVPG